MKLLRFDRPEDLDFPKLMEVYRESNLDNIAYFFPEETDRERGLRAVEAGFRDYLTGDFFASPGNRYYVLEDGGSWVSAIRLFPVPEQPGVWYAEALETAPEQRRKGYARRMMEMLFDLLVREGPFELWDTVHRQNAASLAFHRSLGFEIVQDPAVCPLNGHVNPQSCGLRYRCAGCGSQDPESFDPARLSARYQVRPLTEEDLPAILSLCRGNPLFYRHCPPPPTEQSIREDLAALPPRITPADKHYLGFFEAGKLAAVLDLITGYPRSEIAFWGFFMLDKAIQGQGRGTALVSELCAALARQGSRAVRLGWVRGNPQAEHFWKKNGFVETGVRYDTGGYTVIVAQKELT